MIFKNIIHIHCIICTKLFPRYKMKRNRSRGKSIRPSTSFTCSSSCSRAYQDLVNGRSRKRHDEMMRRVVGG